MQRERVTMKQRRNINPDRPWLWKPSPPAGKLIHGGVLLEREMYGSWCGYSNFGFGSFLLPKRLQVHMVACLLALAHKRGEILIWGWKMTESSLDLQESGWEELRREARKIEGDLDVKLSAYAKLGARFTHGGYVDAGSPTLGSGRSWKSMEIEIQSSLEKLLDINDSMSRCAASAASATSVTQKLARHRDILHEYTQEFRRIKGNINSMREHAELLSSVREDISEYKASGSMSPGVQVLRERASIHGSISHIDEVIGQAQATRAVLGSQRSLFSDVQGKVKSLGDKFPVIRGLLGSIRRRRSRDTLILSAVIAACTLFLIIYWLSK